MKLIDNHASTAIDGIDCFRATISNEVDARIVFAVGTRESKSVIGVE